MGEHWLIKSVRGVNLVTLIVLLLGGANLYFDLDKEIALIKRDLASIEKAVASIELQIRRSNFAAYPHGGNP